MARVAPAAAMSTLAVAGRSDLLFAAAELIERDRGEVRRRVVAADALGIAPPELLERVGRRRDPIAGLALERPLIMGIVNVTPDSFADGGRYMAPDAAIAHALRLEAEGADILDIGAESTRPGAAPVDLQEELRRVMPVIESLAPKVRARLSIDTRKAEVMRRAA